jgi:superfamily II DNA helicase RecQ
VKHSSLQPRRIQELQEKQQLQKALLDDLNQQSAVTVYLFASPQTITTDSTWQGTFDGLIEQWKMKVLTIDECHLFASFGLEFRKEFLDLKDALFSKLAQSPNPIPVLFMTATGVVPVEEVYSALPSPGSKCALNLSSPAFDKMGKNEYL